ncbi:MAG TPA: hypothetical protein VM802_24475 [Chitinophaga sp.]|uniref:hypothetical protein n=1 Tax=Chitinophaga sp. TaxID=1869181 RepID=UPI002B69634F|nr:hypothetical protein [Chitinophaga sp.]HVI48046.1 hypothetical protein [Chitinophaga sp.]
MKTGNKLLLGFAGLLVLLMLFTNIVLRANFSKGITNTQNHRDNAQQMQTLEVSAFKALVLVDDHLLESSSAISDGATTWVEVHKDNKFTLSRLANAKVATRQNGDTLFVNINSNGQLSIGCPSLESIRSEYCNLNLHDITSPSLRIDMSPATEANIDDIKVGSFTYKGGALNKIYIDGGSKIDSLHLQLGKSGTLNWQAPYKYGEMSLDSLREIWIAPEVMSKVKLIK